MDKRLKHPLHWPARFLQKVLRLPPNSTEAPPWRVLRDPNNHTPPTAFRTLRPTRMEREWVDQVARLRGAAGSRFNLPLSTKTSAVPLAQNVVSSADSPATHKILWSGEKPKPVAHFTEETTPCGDPVISVEHCGFTHPARPNNKTRLHPITPCPNPVLLDRIL